MRLVIAVLTAPALITRFLDLTRIGAVDLPESRIRRGNDELETPDGLVPGGER